MFISVYHGHFQRGFLDLTFELLSFSRGAFGVWGGDNKWAGNQKDSVRAGPSGLCPPPLIPKALSSNMDIIKVSSKCPERQHKTEEELEKAPGGGY